MTCFFRYLMLIVGTNAESRCAIHATCALIEEKKRCNENAGLLSLENSKTLTVLEHFLTFRVVSLLVFESRNLI
jgi:hypothetical protein